MECVVKICCNSTSCKKGTPKRDVEFDDNDDEVADGDGDNDTEDDGDGWLLAENKGFFCVKEIFVVVVVVVKDKGDDDSDGRTFGRYKANCNKINEEIGVKPFINA